MSVTTRGGPIVRKPLAHAIVDSGMEVREVARLAGLYPGTVTALLHGRTFNPTTETAARLAVALDTTVEELFPDLVDDGAIDPPAEDDGPDEWDRIAAEYVSGGFASTETAATE